MSSRCCTTIFGFVASLLAAAAIAGAAGTPEQQCQAAKNKAAGADASCRGKAQAALATSGDVTKYTTALGKCDTKFTSAWQQAINKATAAGATCLDAPLTVGDFQPVIKKHTDNVATALGGGGLATCPVVLETGQATSFGPGSDGDLLKGVARSYTDNGDGTITDNVTGLMWEKKSDDGSIHDEDDTYTWGDSHSPFAMNGTMVTTFLATLNAGGGFAGHTDWRIPNRFELESLVNLGTVGPAVSNAFGTGCSAGCTVTTCSCTSSTSYWSSTTYQFIHDSAWTVVFTIGTNSPNFKSESNYVRAVRGGS